MLAVIHDLVPVANVKGAFYGENLLCTKHFHFKSCQKESPQISRCRQLEEVGSKCITV